MLDRTVSSFINVREAFHSQTNRVLRRWSSSVHSLNSEAGLSNRGEVLRNHISPVWFRVTTALCRNAEKRRAKSCWLLKGEQEKQWDIKMSLPGYMKPKPSICVYECQMYLFRQELTCSLLRETWTLHWHFRTQHIQNIAVLYLLSCSAPFKNAPMAPR